jgi:hypothetical protein
MRAAAATRTAVECPARVSRRAHRPMRERPSTKTPRSADFPSGDVRGINERRCPRDQRAAMSAGSTSGDVRGINERRCSAGSTSGDAPRDQRAVMLRGLPERRRSAGSTSGDAPRTSRAAMLRGERARAWLPRASAGMGATELAALMSNNRPSRSSNRPVDNYRRLTVPAARRASTTSFVGCLTAG